MYSLESGSEIKNNLRTILKDIVDDEQLIDKIDNSEDLDFIEDLNFDSLKIMDLIIEIENRFSVRMDFGGDITEVICSLSKLTEWIEVLCSSTKGILL